MKYTIFLLFLFFTITDTTQAQIYATTDDGKRVLLNDNKTWKYVNVENENSNSTYIYMGTDRLRAGIAETVYEESLGAKTSIQLAQKGNQVMLIFWQTSATDFNNWLWTGTVILFLENGETIRLLDRDMKGQNTIKDGYKRKSGIGDGFEINSDLYQRYSAHYLTSAECEKLRRSDISAMSYQTTNPFENGRQNIRITKNAGTSKTQLRTLKK